ncbi:8527_t:CDS:10 [Paraglomus brasilianum]|uniref:8527_t:CDS:1 n=1 Tax=Paraglomus brasilianum TaxID=144538 RepID=A0A9N9A4S1_9GLOM|nr:8527_t:CDS:10 [Paraglomus brasilianum]
MRDRLAATIGSRSTLKKLSKKDVNSVNLIRACNYIVSPPEPLALRLTSNLMVGIARIYYQQYQFYYAEVNNVWGRLRKNLVSLETNEVVNMPLTEARQESITIADDPDFEIEMTLSNLSTVPDFLTFQSIDHEAYIRNAFSSTATLSPASTLHSVFPLSTIDMQDDLLQSDDMDRIQITFDANGTLYDRNISDEHDNRDADIMMDVGEEALGEIYRQVAEEHYRMDDNENGRRRQKQRVKRGERETEETVDGSESRNEECEADDERMMDDVSQSAEVLQLQTSTQPTRRQKRRRSLMDDPNELTMAELILMRNSYSSDLDKAQHRLAYSDRLWTATANNVPPPEDSENIIQTVNPLTQEPEHVRRALRISQNNSSIDVDDIPDFGDHLDHGSSVDTANGSRDFPSDVSSVDGRLRRIGLNHRRRSAVTSDAGASSFGDGLDMHMSDFPIFDDEFNDEASAVSMAPTDQDSQSHSHNVSETEAIVYLNSVLRSANDNRFILQQVVEERGEKKATVAKLFGHILALASKGLVKVSQDVAYGDIIVSSVE